MIASANGIILKAPAAVTALPVNLDRMRNGLLSSLSPQSRSQMTPYLIRENVSEGFLLQKPSVDNQRVCFPETAVAIAHKPSSRGKSVAVGLIGWEGMIGCSALVQNDDNQTVSVFLGGTALFMPVDRLRTLCEQDFDLQFAMLQFVLGSSHQLADALVSVVCDTVIRRLANWLIIINHQTRSETIKITHSKLSDMLKVRRASVTDSLHILEGYGLLRSSRASINIRDLAGLKSF